MWRSSPHFAWVLVFLVFMVLMLQVIHIVIFSYLETLRSEKVTASSKNARLKKTWKPFPYFHMDTRGAYQIHYSVLEEPELSHGPSPYSVTMVTHCSPHNMHYLPALVDQWRGPVSLAVFTSVDDFHFTLSAIRSYAVCYPSIQQNVQFHLVLPLTPLKHILSLNFTHSTIVPCQKLTSYLEKNIKTRNYALTGTPYPNNLLRNVGRLKSRTKFHLVNDIDILPNPGVSKEISKFLESVDVADEIRRTAFVLPVFEVEETSRVPSDKLELIAAVRSGTVRQFYAELCYRCQSNTDYDQWLLHEGPAEGVHVAYLVDYHPMWEPFVITHRSAPLYEERFKQYGYNRISHICELHMAGFTFAVLDSAFLLHQGFKRKGNFHTNKDDENAANRALYQEFIGELHVKYPDSPSSCRDPQ